MKSKLIMAGAISTVILITGITLKLLPDTAVAQSETPVTFLYKDSDVIKLGKAVYAENCAACHGDNLQGEENWRTRNDDGTLRAPPHDETGHTWHHPEQALFNQTKYVLAKLLNDPTIQSTMPAFEETLTDAEILAALSYIKSTWSERIQKMHDERSAQ
jgi:mono/diheme cytochrome c family protein